VSCPFCLIVEKTKPAKFVEGYDFDGFVAFFDKRPQLRSHVIVCSRTHIEAERATTRKNTATRLLMASWEAARVLKLDKHRVIVNTGLGRVPHLHAHLISKG